MTPDSANMYTRELRQRLVFWKNWLYLIEENLNSIQNKIHSFYLYANLAPQPYLPPDIHMTPQQGKRKSKKRRHAERRSFLYLCLVIPSNFTPRNKYSMNYKFVKRLFNEAFNDLCLQPMIFLPLLLQSTIKLLTKCNQSSKPT